VRVEYRSQNGYIHDYIGSLRDGTAFISVASPPPAGTNMRMMVSAPGLGKTFELPAVVEWASGQGGHGEQPGMRVRFDQSPTGVLEELRLVSEAFIVSALGAKIAAELLEGS